MSFKPEAVIYPATEDEDFILVSGRVDGKLRNVHFSDKKLGKELQKLIDVRDKQLAKANKMKEGDARKKAFEKATGDYQKAFKKVADRAKKQAVQIFAGQN